MKSYADEKARERMISVPRNHVLELCEFDHVRFAYRSRVGGRTNRLEGDCAFLSQKPSENCPNARPAGGQCVVSVLNYRSFP